MTTPTFSRQAFEDVASFLPIFGANGFDFGTWVLRQGSFPFVTYHPEVGRFVRTLERHGWVYESPDFLWGPWLRTPEAAGLLSGETLPSATPEQLARLLTVFARQERIVDGSRLEMYQSGVLLAALRRVQSWLEWPPTGDADALPSVRQEWLPPVPAGTPTRQARAFGEPARPRPAALFVPPHPSSSLTFSEAAQRVHAFISQFEEGYFPPLLLLARLAEETGEIARVIAHQNGKTPKPGEDVGDLEMELADLLFVAICLANERGLSLERGFARMMDKIEQRDKDRWTKKVDLSWDVPETEGAEPIEAEAEDTTPEDAMPEVIVTEVPEVSEEPLPTDDLVQIEEAQLDAASDLPDAALPEEPEAAPPVAEAPALSFESVPLDLPPDTTLVISVQPGDVQVVTEESDMIEASSETQAVEDAALLPAEQDPALPEEPSSADSSLPGRTRKGKASGGEIAKPAKAIARKRTTRK
ncbi:DUF6508 domain-containing protein [Deinococcus sp. PESE-13]